MKILICGAGAIGSNLTNRLVADLKGEHEITVLDMDTVEERNVLAGTQFFMRDQIGMSKVEALQYNIYKFHEREIEIIEKQFGSNPGGDYAHKPFSPILAEKYDLIIDCFDNNHSRKHVQNMYQDDKYDILHVGFSDQFTFAVEWADNYQVPDDIVSGMDICEMEGASSFVNYVSSIAATAVLEYIKDAKKIDIVGNKLGHKVLN